MAKGQTIQNQNSFRLIQVRKITIQVKSLKPVIDRLREQNVTFLGNTPTPLTKDSHFALVQYPDGTFVELIGLL